MTAPLKHSASVTVDVALGDRAYDIVIGRDVLQSLGARVAGLRPGVRTAIVTDRTVAKHWLEATEASLAQAGVPTSRIIVDESIIALHEHIFRPRAASAISEPTGDPLSPIL